MTLSKAIRVDPSKRGFALVVTLSLMILLTVIAVGLLTLSSVSLRSSSQGEAAAAARANARLALMMALGDLQKEMGPDSRISAPYDAGKGATSEPLATGGQHWTAVYDAWKWNADAATAETAETRKPKFRGWLVSGANQAAGGPPAEFATLVGSASLSATAKPEDQINAPMLAVSSGNRKGRIAWWTSDESVKAKITAGGDTSLASKPLSDSQSPPHVGHKAIDELADFNWKPGQRAISVSTAEVNLAAGLGATGLGRLNLDVTVHSAGVLADVRQGRLKLDLSNLLSRPIAQLEKKPLYLTDGRINRFQVDANTGSLTNNSWANTNGTGALGTPLSPNIWGINLEELHLFHEIHREVDWTTGKPRLVNKSSTSSMINDRFFMYRRPTMEAVSQIIYFVATEEPKATPTAATTYRLDANMDIALSISNPNDIPTVWPGKVDFLVQTEGFPYRPKWNIRKADGTLKNSYTVEALNSVFFQSSIKNGFTLDPGEAAVFGASTTDTKAEQVNLTRGFALRGAVRIEDYRWETTNTDSKTDGGLKATGLLLTDKLDFSMIPMSNSIGNTPSGWLSSYAIIRDASGGAMTRISTHKYGGGGNSSMSNLYTPASIKPEATSVPTVQNLIGKPLPALMVTTMANVERSRSLLPPNALPSRPYLVHEPATANMTSITNGAPNLLLSMQNSQLLTIAETFNNNRIMTDSTGKNMFHGGAREVGLGGSKYVVKRRIPLSAPLSLGAFENAIACGFFQRFANGPSLSPNADLLPTSPAAKSSKNKQGETVWESQATKVTLAKSIGNSWTNPFLKSDVIQDGTYHDQSWMANTALWDSWFLGGIVKPGPSGAWSSDSRSQKQQFQELAARTANLRNTRLTFHPHKSSADALVELFDGDNLKPAAIDKIAKYLLVDGAFNVNSTSPRAWRAFLASVRGQQLLDVNGAAQTKANPLGTLGYSANSATSGTEADWNGFRDLSDTEINALADKIVDEVKARGPFLNMADFVNRRPNSPDATHSALGALQAAIDKSGINDRFNTAGRTLAPADVAAMPGNANLSIETIPARAIGAAGFLSQGALLTAFGSQITVRGDTFIIRTYGDSRDSADKIQAKAWCEAVVQRTPEFVDPTNPPEASATLTAANTAFGRKFNIVSFRWLSPDEI